MLYVKVEYLHGWHLMSARGTMTDSMRILMVNGGVYPVPSGKGGTENVVYNLTNHLAALGCHIDLVSDVTDDSNFHENISVNPVRLPDLAVYKRGFLGYTLRFVISGWRVFAAARKLLKKDCDVVHLHGRLGPFLLTLLRRERVIYTVHDDPPKKGSAHYFIYQMTYKLFTEGTARRAERVIVLHSQMKKHLVDIGVNPEKICQIPNGVDTGTFTPVSVKVNNGYCLYVGAIIPRKGLDYLVAALSKVDGLECIIVGDGSDRYRIVRMVSDMGLDGRVKFTGAIADRQKLLELYRNASFFILPSLSEAFPLVITEAMACGLPVISTRLPGPAAVIEDGRNGYLVEPADADALAEKMALLKGSCEACREMGECACMLMRENYGWEVIAGRILDMYKEMAGTGIS